MASHKPEMRFGIDSSGTPVGTKKQEATMASEKIVANTSINRINRLTFLAKSKGLTDDETDELLCIAKQLSNDNSRLRSAIKDLRCGCLYGDCYHVRNHDMCHIGKWKSKALKEER